MSRTLAWLAISLITIASRSSDAPEPVHVVEPAADPVATQNPAPPG
ncbi:MAG: hypothetical protein IID30_15775 [Planctomycetes bacterium]|nr:hypothetical protein [Planctomycetota bacterium]